MYGLFAYYLFSPFNLIMLFFNKTDIVYAFQVIVLLKTASMGFTMFYYLSKRKETKWTNLIFSSMYALASFMICYGFNIMWLDGAILLPILILGIDNLIEKNKGVLYTIILSICLITNYYIGFMICIFSLIYFVYKLLCSEKIKIKNILKKSGKFIICSIIAVLVAGVVLLPAFIGIRRR